MQLAFSCAFTVCPYDQVHQQIVEPAPHSVSRPPSVRISRITCRWRSTWHRHACSEATTHPTLCHPPYPTLP